MELKPVFTNKAPVPAGHYSQAIMYNGLLYISGQLPVVPLTGEKITGSIEDQTLQVLNNITSILKAAGSELSKVIKVTVYISDINLWGGVNKIYLDVFGIHKPARSVIPVKDLHYGCKIEMEVIAAT